MANFRKTYSMWSACNAYLRDITDPAKGKVITATMTKLIQNGSEWSMSESKLSRNKCMDLTPERWMFVITGDGQDRRVIDGSG